MSKDFVVGKEQVLLLKNDVSDLSVQVRSLLMSLTSDEDSLNEQLE